MTKFDTAVSAYTHHVSKVDLLCTFPPTAGTASPLGTRLDSLKPSSVNEIQLPSSSSRLSSFSRFNRDEYNLRRKQVKINSILKTTGPLEKIEDSHVTDVQQHKNLKEDEVKMRKRRSYNADIEATRLRRLSQQYHQRTKEPPAGATDKKVVANLSKSVEKLNCKTEETNRKTSLPANIHLPTVDNNVLKPKNWCKDKSWLQESEAGVASNKKRLQLKEWLESCNTLDLMDLQIQLDWENNKPSKTTGTNVDPYNPIRSEKYLIESPDYLEVLQGFSGECVLTLTNNGDNFRGMFDDGQRDGAGTLTFGKIHQRLLGMAKIEGVYEEDMLKGPGTIHYTNGERLRCEFIHGVPNGPGKLFDKDNNIKQVGILSKGFWSGLTWMWKEGGSFLHGPVNYFGQWSGNKIAYIYPDLKHCLLGSFDKGKLDVAQFCYVASIRFIKGYIPHLTYSECQGPLFNYERGTEILMCKNLMVPDPYELNTVVVYKSKMQGGGEGLFAKVDLPAHRIVAFYNGIHEQIDDDDDTEDKEDNWEANAYKIMDMLGTDPQTGKCGIIDVPPEYVSTKNYVASMAHKCNHSFEPNAKFVLGFHPRWGKVPSVQTLKPVKANEEITVSYDYALDKAPPWYQDLYAKRFLDSYMSSKKATNM